MRVEIIESNIFPERYRPLAIQVEQHSFFISDWWLDNFVKTIVDKNDKVIWVGLTDLNNQPLLLLPLWQKSVSAWKIKKLTSLSNYYTTLYEPIHYISDEHLLSEVLNKAIEAVCQLKWDVLDIYPLNPDSINYNLLISAFRQQRKYVTPYFMYGNWFLLTQGQTFQEYYAARPSQLKNTLKRKANRLKQQNLEYRVCTRPDEVESAVQLFEETYKASWKLNEPYPDFIMGLAKSAAEIGYLRIGLLFIDQKIAAAQLWLTLHKTANIFKLCQKPEFDNFSPGSLLTTHLMEYAIDVDNVTKIDFLTGDDQYKKDWMSSRGEHWGLQIANPNSFLGTLKVVENFLVHSSKKQKKRS
jgi:hypothetical protein